MAFLWVLPQEKQVLMDPTFLIGVFFKCKEHVHEDIFHLEWEHVTAK